MSLLMFIVILSSIIELSGSASRGVLKFIVLKVWFCIAVVIDFLRISRHFFNEREASCRVHISSLSGRCTELFIPLFSTSAIAKRNLVCEQNHQLDVKYCLLIVKAARSSSCACCSCLYAFFIRENRTLLLLCLSGTRC